MMHTLIVIGVVGFSILMPLWILISWGIIKAPKKFQNLIDRFNNFFDYDSNNLIIFPYDHTKSPNEAEKEAIAHWWPSRRRLKDAARDIVLLIAILAIALISSLILALLGARGQ